MQKLCCGVHNFYDEDHGGAVSTGGRTITNLRFDDDNDNLAGEVEE